MEAIATPPLSSSSSSASSPSPSFHSADDPTKQAPDAGFSFDDPNTLELLLQTITEHSLDSPPSAHTPDEIPSVSSWSSSENKMHDMGSTFDFPFPMDFEPSISAVDPSALHYNTSIFTQPHASDTSYYLDYSAMDFNPMVTAYDNSQWTQPHTEPGTGRRLSITSSSSSSGASLSPILEPQSAASSSPRSEYALSDADPAAELANRVRQAAGVTLAVPVSKQVQQLAAAGGQTKLPIPRLTRPPQQPSVLKRANSTKSVSPIPEPSPSVTSLSELSAASPSGSDPNSASTTVIGRPKTSHTTIERRYRTNLNARITGLKHAVPALRVLETKDGQSPWNDNVDNRGFVDGVKVARKMSKANILGKATEYIRVLKKRESRLKREQEGLKSLLGGLVGGPALLKEWEREWRDRFGGEEKDEVEGDDLGAGSDDDDGDGEDSEGEDDESGRARKKAKLAKAPKKEKISKPAPPPMALTAPGALPEKRKRGRPRKVPLPPAVPPMSLSAVSSPSESVPAPIVPSPLPQDFLSQQQQNPTPQYLLAAFAFFSVFNSPLASSYTRPTDHAGPHAHGAVLTQPTMVPTGTMTAAVPYGVHDMVQAFHLFVSTLVLFYIVFPWLAGALKGNGVWGKVQSVFADPSPVSPSSQVQGQGAKATSYKKLMLADALAAPSRGQPDESARLRRALGVGTGVVGLLQSVAKAAKVGGEKGLEMSQLEQRAWTRIGELVACHAEPVSRTTRIQTYLSMSWRVSTFSTAPSDLATLALIILPLSSSRATELWTRARSSEILRPYEKVVLNAMGVEDAASLLVRWRRWRDSENDKEKDGKRCAACEKRTPLGVVAAILVRERMRRCAARLFVRSVVPEEDECYDDLDHDEEGEEEKERRAEREKREMKERRETIEAGKSIGGRTAQLASVLERIWASSSSSPPTSPALSTSSSTATIVPEEQDVPEETCADPSSDEAEIRTLLSATLLYRRIFPSPPFSSSRYAIGAVSAILSPPPSPSRKNLALHMSLRAALGSAAFDCADERLAQGLGLGERVGEEREGEGEGEKLCASLDRARDRVNDLLTEVERSARRNVRL